MVRSCKIENKYKWVYSECRDLSSGLIKAAGSKILAKLLVNRAIDSPEKIKTFLDLENVEISSPSLFEHMEKSVERINKAIEKQEHVVIYGDFDADGVTSTSLLFKTLKHLGADVSYFIPDRSEEGHGLSSASVCRLISSKKAKLIITVDCGISNLSEITLAKGLGTDIIVTDHHEGPEVLPPAYAIINPKIIEEDSDLKYLAGVGVAFKLACALLDFYNKQDYIDNILPLVAVGTIADVVPLLGENRALVYRGLKLISEQRSPGLYKLLEITGYKLDQISAEMIAFGVAPRINAIGRLAEASLAVELLVSADLEEIDTIAKKLNYNNKIRQQMCESTFVEAVLKVENEIDLDNDKAIILADSNWHPGIIGIVASKIVEKYYRPAFLLCIDNESKQGRCSARSVEGVKLHEVLTSHSELFEQFGGHSFAAGFSFDLNKYSFEHVKSNLLSTVSECSRSDSFEPKLKIDMDLSLEDLSVDLIEETDKLSPFGECNPSPVFSISNLTLKQFKTMGSSNNHLKIFLSDDNNNVVEAVWWQKDDLDFSVLDKVDVAFCPDINDFGGKTRIQLIVKDIRPADSGNKKANLSRDKVVSIKPEIPVQDTPVLPDLIESPSFSGYKWVDHRKKAGVEKNLLNYLKLSKDKISVFAEKQESLELFQADSLLKSKVISRLNSDQVDQLIFLDLPPDKTVLLDILANCSPAVVHLAGKNYNGTDPGNIIRILSGMLKFAFANRGGEINLNQAASFLNVSNDVVKSCIDLLNMACVVRVVEESSDLIKFEFLGSADLISIVSLDEYKIFLNNIKSMEAFRYELATLDIGKIQDLVCSL